MTGIFGGHSLSLDRTNQDHAYLFSENFEHYDNLGQSDHPGINLSGSTISIYAKCANQVSTMNLVASSTVAAGAKMTIVLRANLIPWGICCHELRTSIGI